MKTLDQIAIEYGTDKATQFTRTYAKPKGYTIHYERFFEPLRDKPIRLVEIGVGGGESVTTWLDYFTNGLVMGIDLVSGTNYWNKPRQWNEGSRYAFMAADQTDPTFWACFAADVGKTVDIAIDDGSHEPKAIITSFMGLWPLIKPGGYYCVEDTGCGFTNPGFPTHAQWVSDLCDQVQRGQGEIDSVYQSRELVVLRKKSTL